jgi:hypothetical protein
MGSISRPGVLIPYRLAITRLDVDGIPRLFRRARTESRFLTIDAQRVSVAENIGKVKEIDNVALTYELFLDGKPSEESFTNLYITQRSSQADGHICRQDTRGRGPMQFQSKLLQRRAAAAGGVTLNKIYDVYIKPDGRVEGEGGDVGEALEHSDEVIERLRSPKSGG